MLEMRSVNKVGTSKSESRRYDGNQRNLVAERGAVPEGGGLHRPAQGVHLVDDEPADGGVVGRSHHPGHQDRGQVPLELLHVRRPGRLDQ